MDPHPLSTGFDLSAAVFAIADDPAGRFLLVCLDDDTNESGAAAAFAGAMAFSGGGVVPGVGNMDTVPAMLTPGEGVVPKGVMEGLSVQARNGNMGGGNHFHAHVNPTYHLQALDTDGMQKVLDRHSAVLQKHVESTFRKMNR